MWNVIFQKGSTLFFESIKDLSPDHRFILLLVLVVIQPIIIYLITRFKSTNNLTHSQKQKASKQIYDILTTQMFLKVKEEARKLFVANGFDKKKPDELVVWLKGKMSKLTTPALEFFQREYDDSIMLVPFDINNPNYNDNEIFFKALSIFSEAQIISNTAKDMIRCLELKKDREIEKLKVIDGTSINIVIRLIMDHIEAVNKIKTSIIDNQCEMMSEKVDAMHLNIVASFYDRVDKKKPKNAFPFSKFISFKYSDAVSN